MFRSKSENTVKKAVNRRKQENLLIILEQATEIPPKNVPDLQKCSIFMKGVLYMDTNTQESNILEKLNKAAKAINYDINPDAKYDKDGKKRDFFITINEKAECYQSGLATYENMANYLNTTFSFINYACWDEEIGDNGNLHLHLFISFKNNHYFSSICKKFKGAHVQPKKGSAFFAMNYIKKPKGLQLNGVEKSHTQTKPMQEIGDFSDIEEKGKYDKDGTEIVKQQPEKVPINQRIKDLVAKFDTLEEIANADPYIFNTYRSTLQELFNQKQFEQFVSNPRVEKFEGREGTFYKVNKLVFYIFGQEGSGKTFSTRLEYGGKGKVGKVTFNKGIPNFDNYNGEPVMYLNEFKGNIPMSVLQNLLEEEPTMLDARYADKQNFAITYIFDSNIPFENLYPNVKTEEPDKYRSFVRRFTGGVWETYQTDDGVRYIALHEELLPKSSRYGDKYDPNKLSPPFSEKWTGFKRISLQKMQEIKDYEWTYIFKREKGQVIKQEGYRPYHEWEAIQAAQAELTDEEAEFLFLLNYEGPNIYDEEKAFYDEAIAKSEFPDDRKPIMLHAEHVRLAQDYKNEATT